MRTIKSKSNNSTKSKVDLTTNSRNELPILSQSDKLLIDARLMHEQLGSRWHFSDWIKKHIKEYDFQEDEDFFRDFRKTKVGRSRKEYYLTLDMAKELAMLERSEVGRSIRRYFIEQERKVRGVSQLPDATQLFADLKPKTINDRNLYPYREMLRRCGYSDKSGSSSRKARYWMHFVKEGNLLYITEEFALHLYNQRNVYNNRKSLVNKPPVLALNFADTTVLNNVPQLSF